MQHAAIRNKQPWVKLLTMESYILNQDLSRQLNSYFTLVAKFLSSKLPDVPFCHQRPDYYNCSAEVEYWLCLQSVTVHKTTSTKVGLIPRKFHEYDLFVWLWLYDRIFIYREEGIERIVYEWWTYSHTCAIRVKLCPIISINGNN